MNEMRLLRLAMEHFKGQERLTLDFGGKSASIFGENAAGKTTVYDALTWLLFGKDSHGQSSFEIKPLGEDGKVRDHAVITSVEAILESGGATIALKKTYYEKWATRRGGVEEFFDGNTSDYFVDGVPSKKYEFERRVSELVQEDVFRLLTGTTYFCAELDWRKRREVLFEVCGVEGDLAIMAREARFDPLASALGGLSLDDYRRKLQAQRKGLLDVRSDVPVRLDECQHITEELGGIDFAALQVERDARAQQRDKLSAELLKLGHNTLLGSKRNERDGLQNQLEKLEQENEAFRRSQIVPTADDGSSLRAELDWLKRSIARQVEKKLATAREIGRYEEEIEGYRASWAEANAKGFEGGTCQSCGQRISGAFLKEAESRFWADKETELDAIVAASERAKAEVAAGKNRMETLIEEVVDAENQAAALTGKLAALSPTAQPAIVDTPDFPQKRDALTVQIAALEASLAALAGESSSIQAEIKAKIAVLVDEIAAIEAELSKQAMLRHTQQRMEKLRAEAQAAAQQIGALDEALFLCEQFVRYKVQFIEEDVSSRFKLARFKLFDEQVNGGLSECCEATVEGVPYASLNSGARTNVGMDVIATLSQHYGAKVPLFVDNAESVTQLYEIDTQVIRLVVSEADKKLRCEA